jgi:hypothetical protein
VLPTGRNFGEKQKWPKKISAAGKISDRIFHRFFKKWQKMVELF